MTCHCNLYVMNNASPCVNRLMNTVQVQPFLEEFPGFMSGRAVLAMALAATFVINSRFGRKKYRAIALNRRVCKPGKPESSWFRRRKPRTHLFRYKFI